MILLAKNISAILMIIHVRMYTAILDIFSFSSMLSPLMRFHLHHMLRPATTISQTKTFAGSRSLDNQLPQLITGLLEGLSLLITMLATMHLIETSQRLDLLLRAGTPCKQLRRYLIPPMSQQQLPTQVSTLTHGQAAHTKYQDTVEQLQSSSV